MLCQTHIIYILLLTDVVPCRIASLIASAQRHFCRATRLDPQCAEAWIAFGASFAACDESDQALASFRAAQRLAPGNHISLLYIGMEYLRTNHLVLASHFLAAANDSCNGTDALAKSELGVLHLYQKNYKRAIAWFLQALGCSVERLRESSRQNSESMMDVDSLILLVEGLQDEYWVRNLPLVFGSMPMPILGIFMSQPPSFDCTSPPRRNQLSSTWHMPIAKSVISNMPSFVSSAVCQSRNLPVPSPPWPSVST